MLPVMRSTLTLDDQLFRKATRRAATLNTTLSDVVDQALRELLSRPIAEPSPFEMVTFGNSKRRVHHEPGDIQAEIEDEERGALRRR
jgi:Arc/MetJ family transcription regulator